MNDDEFNKKWVPILKPIWEETNGFTAEQWEAWVKDDKNKDKCLQLIEAFLAFSAGTTIIFQSSEKPEGGEG